MATKIWKIENDLCRCCHAEGTFDNLAEPRTFLEKEEIYSDMLREYLDVDISPVPGDLCATTYTICHACVIRLRDACNFKKQVQDCEERFMALYYKNAIKGLNSTIDTVVKEEPDTNLEDHTEDDRTEDEVEIEFKEEDSSQMDEDDQEYIKDDEDDISDEDVKETNKRAKGRPKGKTEKKEKTKRSRKKIKEEKSSVEKEKKGTNYTVIDEKYVCNVCDKSYASKELMSQHFRYVHLKKRPKERKCPHCPKKITRYQRANHLEEEHNIVAPTCGVCNKKFRFPCHVIMHHKKVHMGEKTFDCSICTRSFFDGRSLRLHSLTHSNERRFKCDVCEKKFRWNHNLKDHLRIHNEDRRYKCAVCDNAFVQKASLNYHMTKYHPEVNY